MAAQVSRSILAKIVAVIDEGELKLEEIMLAAGLPEQIFKEACTLLASNQVGIWSGDKAIFGRVDKVKAALLLCKLGEPLDKVSKILKWSEFEDFAATLLEGEGYTVRRRFRLKDPRCEIDVLAVKDDLALVIDCKHWRRVGSSLMNKIVDAQIQRVKVLVAQKPGFVKRCEKFLPVILTLYSEDFTMLEGVPIVPINLLSDFIVNIRGYLDEMNVISY